MDTIFKTVTKQNLNKIRCNSYGAGNKLKINDKITSGFTINYSNLNGISASKYNSDYILLSLKLFVEKNGTLYELYKNIK
jgi:hypothetical protein